MTSSKGGILRLYGVEIMTSSCLRDRGFWVLSKRDVEVAKKNLRKLWLNLRNCVICEKWVKICAQMENITLYVKNKACEDL